MQSIISFLAMVLWRTAEGDIFRKPDFCLANESVLCVLLSFEHLGGSYIDFKTNDSFPGQTGLGEFDFIIV